MLSWYKYQVDEMWRNFTGETFNRKSECTPFKNLIGCMSESSCGVAAAASTQSEADWVDSSGHYLYPTIR